MMLGPIFRREQAASGCRHESSWLAPFASEQSDVAFLPNRANRHSRCDRQVSPHQATHFTKAT